MATYCGSPIPVYDKLDIGFNEHKFLNAGTERWAMSITIGGASNYLYLNPLDVKKLRKFLNDNPQINDRRINPSDRRK